MKNSLDVVIVVGLLLGAALGMFGTMATSQHLRAISWAIDSTGLIVATSLLTIKFFRAGNDLVAAGILVFAIGEAVMLSGTASSLEASVPAFAAGTALWTASLLMTSIPKEFAMWTRITGIIAALLFGFTSERIFCGETLLPIDKPLPYFAYPFLVLTFIGWIIRLVRSR